MELVSSADCLSQLPVEIILLIVDNLPYWETKQLSQVNKKIRAICIPTVFRSVQFEFSRTSLRELKALSMSELRYHVISFTYVVPELLKTELIEFEHFKSSILTPEDYVEEARALFDFGYPPSECPPYMAIFLALQKICRKQNHIVESGIDQAALTLGFRVFSQMRELTIQFCVTMERKHWLESYIDLGRTMTEKSYEHHVRVISEALFNARSRGSLIDTVQLSGLQIPQYRYGIPDLMSLAGYLQDLLRGIRNVRVTQSDSTLVDLLSRDGLSIHQFDICYMIVDYRSLKRFLAANHNSLLSVGFHDVQISGVPFHQNKLPHLNVDILSALMDARTGTHSQETYCYCLPQHKSWRFFLGDEILDKTELSLPQARTTSLAPPS